MNVVQSVGIDLRSSGTGKSIVALPVSTGLGAEFTVRQSKRRKALSIQVADEEIPEPPNLPAICFTGCGKRFNAWADEELGAVFLGPKPRNWLCEKCVSKLLKSGCEATVVEPEPDGRRGPQGEHPRRRHKKGKREAYQAW